MPKRVNEDTSDSTSKNPKLSYVVATETDDFKVFLLLGQVTVIHIVILVFTYVHISTKTSKPGLADYRKK